MGNVWPTTKDVTLTFLRWFAGMGLGTIIGLFIASLESLVVILLKDENWPRWMISIPLDFLRSLPIIALVPLIQMIGIGEKWKIGLIAWAVTFPVWISVRQARTRTLPDTELALTACGLDQFDILLNYHLPKAFGGLLRGVEISIGIAWLSVVAAEWIGTFSTGFWAGGIGYKVVTAHEANSWASMFACLALFGILGTTTAWAWRKLFPKNREFLSGFSPMSGYGE